MKRIAKRITLAEYVSQVGQTGAASALGCTQPGIRKALCAERTVYVDLWDDGAVSAEEIKPFPAAKAVS